jgi:hypothetical protein
MRSKQSQRRLLLWLPQLLQLFLWRNLLLHHLHLLLALQQLSLKYQLVIVFSAANTVEVQEKGVIPVKDLRIGDRVKSADGSMGTVYSFGHYQPDVNTEYIRIHAKGHSKVLEISKDHLIFVNGTAVPVSSVAIGDKVDLGAGRGSSEVIKMKAVTRKGAFAPFTMSGTIVVSGVVASAYVTLQKDSSTLSIGAYSTPLTMHWLAHVFETPHRLFCKFRMDLCMNETYNVDGISSWVEKPLHIGRWFVNKTSLWLSQFSLLRFCWGSFSM